MTNFKSLGFEERRYKSERHFALDTQPAVWPSCSGPCAQGRKVCPSPQSCSLPEDDYISFSEMLCEVFGWRVRLAVALMLVGACLVLVFGDGR